VEKIGKLKFYLRRKVRRRIPRRWDVEDARTT